MLCYYGEGNRHSHCTHDTFGLEGESVIIIVAQLRITLRSNKYTLCWGSPLMWEFDLIMEVKEDFPGEVTPKMILRTEQNLPRQIREGGTFQS